MILMVKDKIEFLKKRKHFFPRENCAEKSPTSSACKIRTITYIGEKKLLGWAVKFPEILPRRQQYLNVKCCKFEDYMSLNVRTNNVHVRRCDGAYICAFTKDTTLRPTHVQMSFLFSFMFRVANTLVESKLNYLKWNKET